ncbi:type II toxin-antitoxin system RelE family toxin [Schleiferilactobacillus shenzhenensis]|uniref:Addiction module toxin RelE n=1 Tax=Schleiferilactobacillus shenzhenensis LY-73 TaxID=1231336 RepID=U4TM32_9LACO|nr:hypothetical protein [Schleiferilactobacillus shenzhenensis]ERL64460.1 hypothetical protein L248_0871 [Schleiferilactobacillus shenzhenensis LY-73]
MSNYSISWFEEAKKEYDNLDGQQRQIIDKGLDRIKNLGIEAGQPLAKDLAGFRKLKYKKLGLRIVFGQVGKTVRIIDILAIGRRDAFAVYRDAVSRLRQYQKDHPDK